MDYRRVPNKVRKEAASLLGVPSLLIAFILISLCGGTVSLAAGAESTAGAQRSKEGYFRSPIRDLPEIRVEDHREEWNSVFTVLEGENVSERYQYLLESLPMLLLGEVKDIPTHTLSSEELKARRIRLLEKKIRTKEKELHQQIKERDELFLDGEAKGKIQKATKKIRLIREEIRLIEWRIEDIRDEKDTGKEEGGGQEFTAEKDKTGESSHGQDGRAKQFSYELVRHVQVDVRKHVPFSPPKADTKKVLEPHPHLPLSVFSHNRGVDAVVYGTMEQVEEALYVEMKLYNADTDLSQPFFEGIIFPDKLEENAAEVGKELTTLILGKKWAHLSVETKPAQSTIMVNERKYPGGDHTIRYLEPGTYRVEANAEGYSSAEKTVTVEAGTKSSVEIELKPEQLSTFTVQTVPRGAEVFAKTVRVGTTPFTFDEVVLPLTISLKKSGYYEESLVVKESSERKQIQVDLHPRTIDKKGIVESARARFYSGVAGFFLTLPITLVGYGMSAEYAYAFEDAVNEQVNEEELARLHGLSTVWYTTYLGGLFLNGVFLVDSIIHMKRYIRAAEGQ